MNQGHPQELEAKVIQKYLRRYTRLIKKHVDSIDTFEDKMTKLYSPFWGQCTNTLKVSLLGHEDFNKNEIESDVKWLLNQIKLITQGIKEEKHSYPNDSVY